jgi:flagellar biosynthesis/type III secretory pathway chaperone
METQEILEKLEQLLEEERMAIRTLRGHRVHEIACEKLELMKRLDATRDAGWKEYAPRVQEVVRRLRHNSVLLVHAKSILTEAIRVKRARLASSTRAAPRVEPKLASSRLSVVG